LRGGSGCSAIANQFDGSVSPASRRRGLVDAPAGQAARRIVFVDGYYAGIVDDFDGTFQRLHVDAGQHRIELFLPGHRLYTQDLYLQPGNTFTVRHTMESLAAGEPEPERPTGSPRAAHRAEADAAATGLPISVPPPNSSYGTLAIRVQPGDGLVLIDGERWSGSDESIEVQLAPGAHTVEVRKAGFRGYLTEVTVKGGEPPGSISRWPPSARNEQSKVKTFEK
jgi:hypothetical protein